MKQSSVERITDSVVAAQQRAVAPQRVNPALIVFGSAGVLIGIGIIASVAYLARAMNPDMPEAHDPWEGKPTSPPEEIAEAISTGFADIADAIMAAMTPPASSNSDSSIAKGEGFRPVPGLVSDERDMDIPVA